MALGCMIEVPCPHRKDLNGVEHCMKEEGDCEYQVLENIPSKCLVNMSVPRLRDGLSITRGVMVGSKEWMEDV